MGDADLTDAVLSLPRQERAALALRLVESLDELGDEALSPEEWDRQALIEARRRWSAYAAGETDAVPAAEVIARLRAQLRSAG